MLDPGEEPAAASTGGSGTPSRPALARCLALDVDTFATEHWGRAPLLSRAADLPGDLAALLTLDDVDEVLSVRGLRTPFVRLAKDGHLVEEARWTGGMGAGAGVADQVRSGSVLAQVVDGATVVLQGLHRFWPALIELGDQLSVDLGHPTQVNAYITPPGNRGFDAHYDTHDVLVIQTAGRKHWTVHGPVVELPGPDDPWTDHRDEVAAAAQGPAVIDTVLEPGDVLYLPRGYLHSARAATATSCHLTVGIHPVTGVTVATGLLALLSEQAAADAQLRRALPLGVDAGDPEQTTAVVQATIDRMRLLLDTLDPTAAADRLRSAAWAQVRPSAVSPLAQASALASLCVADLLRVRPRLRTRLVEGDAPVLLAGQGRFPVEPGSVAAVRALLAVGECVVGDLPGLDAAAQVALARRLVLDGCAVLG